jgi:FixJ family two-component response regulator
MGKAYPALTMRHLGQVIAIVDDDPSICQAVARLVRSLGMTPVTFKSGEDFLRELERVSEFRPDCVVLDVQMPGLNGLEVEERIPPRKIPVIFMTALAEDVAQKQFRQRTILFKPFDQQTFVNALTSAFLSSDPS